MASKAASENKSKAIRDYKTAHEDAKPKEIAAALGRAGHKVTPGFISTVLSNDRRKARKGRRGGGRKSAARQSDAYAGLVQAKKLSDQMGGIEQARAALDALAKILNA